MKIRTRLWLITLATLAATLAVAVIVITANRQLAREQAQIENAQLIVEALFRLRGRTSEYLVRPGARPKAQWHAEQQEIEKRLPALAVATPEEKALADSMRQDLERSHAIFDHIETLGARAEETGGREILSGQLQLKIQAVAGGMIRLEELMRQRIAQTQRDAAIMGAALMALLLAVIATGSLLLARSILGPLDALRKGTEIIGAGNLEHRIGIAAQDEIGDLSRAFERMEKQLKEKMAELRTTSQLLQESQALSRIAGQMAKLGAWAVELPGMRIIWSDETCRIHEVPDGTQPSLEQAINFYTPESRGRIQEAVGKCINDGTPYEEELQIVTARGNLRSVLTYGEAVRNEAGAITRIQGAFQDITQRKQIEEKVRAVSRYARSLIEASQDPLVTISADGRITDVNEATVKATGVAREALVGSDFSGYFTEPDKARAGYREVFAKGYVTDYPLSLRHVSGSVMEVLYNASVYRNEAGEVAGVFAAARDVTERKRAEQELRKSREQLEARVRERTAELEAANRDLEEIIYSLAHDLGIPVRAVNGFAYILQTQYRDRLDEEGNRCLNIVQDNTRRMGRLIDDILAFSRLRGVAMRVEEINMEQVAHAVLDELQPMTAGRMIEFEIKPLPSACGDPAMLRQVWLNLLSNAVKFTRPTPMARIEAGCVAEATEQIYYVKDNGAGFDMQYADKLFGVFQRLHGVDEFEGTGIGLAIVKRIITRHGGRVWAEGKVNEGATFYFALPIKEVST